jgi:hypothetical protein
MTPNAVKEPPPYLLSDISQLQENLDLVVLFKYVDNPLRFGYIISAN